MAVLITLLLTELGAQLLLYLKKPHLYRPGFGQLLALDGRNGYVPDSDLTYRFRPDSTLRLLGPGYDVTYQTNSSGYTDDEFRGHGEPADQSASIVVMGYGDSFAQGMGIPQGQSVYALLEAQLRAMHPDAVVNDCAVPGYGQCQQLAQTCSFSQRYRPDLSIYLIYCMNDPVNNREGITFEDLSDPETPRWWPPEAVSRIVLDFLESRRLSRLDGPEDLPLWALPHIDPSVPFVAPMWHTTKSLLREISEENRKAGCHALFVLFPYSHYKTFDQLVPPSDSFHRKLLSAAAPLVGYRKVLAELKADVLDLTPAFLAQADFDALFLAHDHHFTPAGHRLVADELLAYLLAKELVPSSR